jgi:hypothetical protein
MTTSAGACADRRTIDLDGVWNLRDLGGLPTRAGGLVRRGRLFRSGTLWFASNADLGKPALRRMRAALTEPDHKQDHPPRVKVRDQPLSNQCSI